MLQKWFTAIYERQWRVVMSGILLVALPVILFVACAITPFIYLGKYHALTAGMNWVEIRSITGLYARDMYYAASMWGLVVGIVGLVVLAMVIFYGSGKLYKTLGKTFTDYQPRKKKDQ